MEDMTTLIKALRSRFGITDIREQREDLTFLSVPKDRVIPLLTHLRDHEGFSSFILLTAVDWMEEEVFQLTYMLNNPEEKHNLGIRTQISREEPVMESAHHLWEHVATFQRELKEMFGIVFPGSPHLNEEFLLEGWDNLPPMRRDFDTKKYSEETYFPRPGRKTKDPAEHMKEKLYPNEPRPQRASQKGDD